MNKTLVIFFASFFVLGWINAQEEDPVGMVPTDEDSKNVDEKIRYSPYAGRNFPTNVYWGDTHVHTDNSLDARGFGAMLNVEDAYRFAMGEEVVSSSGVPMKLSRPLDWLVVADHSDGMGSMKEIIKGNPRLLSDPQIRAWHNQFNAGGEEAFKATMDVINAFSQGQIPEAATDATFVKTIWDEYLKTAEKYNHPGNFTAMIGYEWTSTENGNNLHRNVLCRDGIAKASQMIPYTAADSFNPEDLWKWMETYEKKTGKVPLVGNTVDVKNATWTNTIGDPEFITVWTDPDFDPDVPAFYYARIIEIPTPRWTAYDAKRYGVKLDDNVWVTIQERAYTSPIWYNPDK